MPHLPTPASSSSQAQPKIVIIGAGFGGIGQAIELGRRGYTDVTILEAGPEIGGTWFFNDYPGAACDIPSQLYSFSYAQRRDWKQDCTPQAQILEYLQSVAADHGVDRQVVTGARVTSCTWDDEGADWTITTETAGTHRADAVILAIGQLNQPALPAIPGLGDFAGESFHSARWNHDYDLTGKRVGVIGNGASAVQFVPEIVDQAGQLTVFQRTGNWFMPRGNHPYSRLRRLAIARIPGLQSARRRFFFHVVENLTRAIRNPKTVGRALALASGAFMRWQLRGHPELRRQLWPDYAIGCKRVLFSSKFLPALTRPNAAVVTDHIIEVTPTGVRTANGTHHELDCLIHATGFRTTDFMFPMEIHGTQGRSLRDTWVDGAHAHLGMTIPGFPSLFLLYGPNTNTSGGSIIFFLETQAAYVRQALDLVRAAGPGSSIDVRAEVEAASDTALQAAFGGTAWTSCDSWYRTASGRIVTNWPGYMGEYRERTRTLDPAEFTVTSATRIPMPSAAEE